MSEKEIKTETTETKEVKVNDVVSDNVAMLKSRIIALEALNKDLTESLDALDKKYTQAVEFIQDDLKADLLAYISPRYDMPEELLVLKTVDELKDIKIHIDRVEVPAFRAGTKVVDHKKKSQRSMLESTFDVAQAKRLEGNK